MIYFGDGSTDVPSMKVVQQNGGTTIAVFAGDSNKADQLFSDARAKMTAEFKSLMINSVLAILAIALVVAMTVYFISRTISKPIIQLTVTVKKPFVAIGGIVYYTLCHRS